MQKSLTSVSKLIKFIFSFFLSVLGFYYAFNKVDVSQLWFYLKTANIFYIVLSILLIIFSVAIRAERWQLLLEPFQKISFRPLFLNYLKIEIQNHIAYHAILPVLS